MKNKHLIRLEKKYEKASNKFPTYRFTDSDIQKRLNRLEANMKILASGMNALIDGLKNNVLKDFEKVDKQIQLLMQNQKGLHAQIQMLRQDQQVLHEQILQLRGVDVDPDIADRQRGTMD